MMHRRRNAGRSAAGTEAAGTSSVADDSPKCKEPRRRRPVPTQGIYRKLGASLAVVPLVFFMYSARLLRHHDQTASSASEEAPLMLHTFDGAASRTAFPTLESLTNNGSPDFGGIQMKARTGFGQHIRETDDQDFEQYRQFVLEAIDEPHVSLHYYHDEELDYAACQRPSFHKIYYSNCLSFHEIDMSRSNSDSRAVPAHDVHLFSHGYFRDVWKITPYDGSDPFLMKTNRWDWEFDADYIGMIKRDATVMIALSDSPRIVDILGACSASIMVVPALGQIQLEFLWKPPFGDDETEAYISPSALNDTEAVRPLNNLTATQKIDYALAMSEAIADLHGYQGGVIIHDDMTPDQWLRAKNGAIVLGDFNRALFLDWNVETNEYCKTDDGKGFGFYRAPEEKLDLPQTEQVDVWAFGCQLYGLLTGLRPYYWDDWRGFKKKVRKGIRPYVDKRYYNRSYAEAELINIMKQTWEKDAEDRISIFEVVRRLRQVRDEIHKQNNQ